MEMQVAQYAYYNMLRLHKLIRNLKLVYKYRKIAKAEK